MEKGIVYRSFEVPFVFLSLLNSMSEKPEHGFLDYLYPPTQYQFADFKFNDLAIRSKDDAICLNELIKRVSRMLYHYASWYCKNNPFVDFSEAYQTLLDAIRDAIRIYNPDRGPFENLMRKTLHNALEFLEYNIGRCYIRRKKILETWSSSPRSYYVFADSEPEDSFQLPDRTKLKIDFEEYKKLLSPKEKLILEMYISGFTLRQIQKKTNMGLTMIQNTIQRMIGELEEREKRKMI